MPALTLPVPPAADPFAHLPPVAPFRWTRAEFYRLADAGYFAGKRVMLIDGEVLAMSPQNEPHAWGVVNALNTLQAAMGPVFTYRPQLPLDIGQASDPEPDVAVVPGRPPRRPGPHPTTAALVVEVADSSLAYDTGDKGGLYAAGGVTDYWVVDLAHGRLVVFRDPRPDPAARFGHAYASVLYLGPGDTLAPLAAPHAMIAVVDLLP
ncbi:MAG TPA: Uma2 family endonuclease [Urbifossiella sp.]|nr:Uma2 family endonuclease [Urbifossiella sp.]